MKYLKTKESIGLVAASKFVVIVGVVSLKEYVDRFGGRICLGVFQLLREVNRRVRVSRAIEQESIFSKYKMMWQTGADRDNVEKFNGRLRIKTTSGIEGSLVSRCIFSRMNFRCQGNGDHE